MTGKFVISLLGLALSCCSLNSDKGVAAVKVEIVNSDTGSGFELLRAGEPYVINGAGLEYGDIVSFAAHGGNSIRNWTTENAGSVLDAALENGVTVALCLPVRPERWGFDYNDARAVARQLEAMREEVIQYRDHPALLAWIIGNELNFDYSNSNVYDAVNEISEMIHQLDPNHPTTTTVAGLGENVLRDLETRAPDLDFYSFQVYGELFNLPEFVRQNNIQKPISITEWGAIGHWEVPTTNWGAPIEMNSSEKANVYLRGFKNALEPLGDRIIGSYAFLWGQKQERTATWFGMFTETGEETETVDVMHWMWNGEWPENRSPVVHMMKLDGKSAQDNVELRSGQIYQAAVEVSDPDNDVLSYRWELKPESDADEVGGDLEAPIANLDAALAQQDSSLAKIIAPTTPGAYRLYVNVYDGNNNAAHANIPFLITR